MYRSKVFVWTLAMWQMICFTSVAVAYSQEATRATPKQLVFSATPGAKGILYKVDDTTVSDQLRGFGKAVEKYGDEWPVVCLIDCRYASFGRLQQRQEKRDSRTCGHLLSTIVPVRFLKSSLALGCQYPINNSGNAAMTRVAADYLHDVRLLATG